MNTNRDSLGAFGRWVLSTTVHDPAHIKNCAIKYSLDHYLPAMPSLETGFLRAVARLKMVTDNKIPVDGIGMDRAHCLKITDVSTVESGHRYDIYLHFRNAEARPLHVLTVSYRAGWGAVQVQDGVSYGATIDAARKNGKAWEVIGSYSLGGTIERLVQDLVRTYHANYNDADLRAMVAEAIRPLYPINVLGGGTVFVCPDKLGSDDTVGRPYGLKQVTDFIGEVQSAHVGAAPPVCIKLAADEDNARAVADTVAAGIGKLIAEWNDAFSAVAENADGKRRTEKQVSNIHANWAGKLSEIRALMEHNREVLEIVNEKLESAIRAQDAKLAAFLRGEDMGEVIPLPATAAMATADAADPFADMA